MIINAPIRGNDAHGSGAYLSSRGSRKHKGIDIACHKGSGVLSIGPGHVTKIGYPYDPSDPKKGHLRYVQVTDEGGRKLRYFYITPSVKVGDIVDTHTELGVTQGLTGIYPGIIDHFHFEILVNGLPVDPKVENNS